MMAGVVETYSVHILAKGIAKAGTEALSRLHRRFEEGRGYARRPMRTGLVTGAIIRRQAH